MKHHQYNPNFKFVIPPVEFNKNSDRELLKYCLGATLYMPATKDFSKVIINKEMLGLTSMVMCFEDAINENSLPQAEENSIRFLGLIDDAVKQGLISENDIPLIFFRVRSTNQFEQFSKRLSASHLKVLTGFVFPKFSTHNAQAYLSNLRNLNNDSESVLYCMPILEGREIAFKESRLDELIGINKIVQEYRDLIINIRVGATDFSSCFGVRRGIVYTVYDILTVKDCLLDVLNTFSRDNNFVISGPVWEYFLATKDMKFKSLPATNSTSLSHSFLKRDSIFNTAIDGLIREVILDKANGFIGKTIIHPTHLRFVNALQAVTKEEYDDAAQILETSGGVIKSLKENKMNEIKPHRSWAEKIFQKSKAYGVVQDDSCYLKLFSNEV
jgi:citrate lyase beta subunit